MIARTTILNDNYGTDTAPTEESDKGVMVSPFDEKMKQEITNKIRQIAETAEEVLKQLRK